MNPGEFRAEMEERWLRFSDDAERFKDSNSATFAFCDWYDSLDAEQRRIADPILAEWVHSSDDKRQFDALAVIHKFGIRSALPSLRELTDSLTEVKRPEVRYLRLKVLRLVEELGGQEGKESSG